MKKKLFLSLISFISLGNISLHASKPTLEEQAYGEVLTKFQTFQATNAAQKQALDDKELNSLKNLSLKGSPRSREIFQELIYINSSLVAKQTSAEIMMEELAYERVRQLIDPKKVDAYLEGRSNPKDNKDKKRPHEDEIRPLYQKSRQELGHLLSFWQLGERSFSFFKPASLSDAHLEALREELKDLISVLHSVRTLEQQKARLEKDLRNTLTQKTALIYPASPDPLGNRFSFQYHRLFKECDVHTRRLDLHHSSRLREDFQSNKSFYEDSFYKGRKTHYRWLLEYTLGEEKRGQYYKNLALLIEQAAENNTEQFKRDIQTLEQDRGRVASMRVNKHLIHDSQITEAIKRRKKDHIKALIDNTKDLNEAFQSPEEVDLYHKNLQKVEQIFAEWKDIKFDSDREDISFKREITNNLNSFLSDLRTFLMLPSSVELAKAISLDSYVDFFGKLDAAAQSNLSINLLELLLLENKKETQHTYILNKLSYQRPTGEEEFKRLSSHALRTFLDAPKGFSVTQKIQMARILYEREKELFLNEREQKEYIDTLHKKLAHSEIFSSQERVLELLNFYFDLNSSEHVISLLDELANKKINIDRAKEIAFYVAKNLSLDHLQQLCTFLDAAVFSNTQKKFLPTFLEELDKRKQGETDYETIKKEYLEALYQNLLKNRGFWNTHKDGIFFKDVEKRVMHLHPEFFLNKYPKIEEGKYKGSYQGQIREYEGPGKNALVKVGEDLFVIHSDRLSGHDVKVGDLVYFNRIFLNKKLEYSNKQYPMVLDVQGVGASTISVPQQETEAYEQVAKELGNANAKISYFLERYFDLQNKSQLTEEVKNYFLAQLKEVYKEYVGTPSGPKGYSYTGRVEIKKEKDKEPEFFINHLSNKIKLDLQSSDKSKYVDETNLFFKDFDLGIIGTIPNKTSIHLKIKGDFLSIAEKRLEEGLYKRVIKEQKLLYLAQRHTRLKNVVYPRDVRNYLLKEFEAHSTEDIAKFKTQFPQKYYEFLLNQEESGPYKGQYKAEVLKYVYDAAAKKCFMIVKMNMDASPEKNSPQRIETFHIPLNIPKGPVNEIKKGSTIYFTHFGFKPLNNEISHSLEMLTPLSGTLLQCKNFKILPSVSKK